MATFPDIIEPPYEFQKLLGFEMTEWTAERAVINVQIRKELTNRYGIPHGGVYAALLDTVMGYSGCFTGSPTDLKFVMTLTMTTNFVSRPKGELLIGEGRVVGGGKRTFFADGKITDETGELIATGSGTFRYRSNSVKT